MKSYLEDPEYKSLYYSWIEARRLIRSLNVDQFIIREELRHEVDPEKVKELRGKLMTNRKGSTGLRSLNKRIRAYYRYCEKNHIFPY